MKNVFVRALFLGVILIGAHDFAHAATLCNTTTNPCNTFHYHDYTTGKIYCRMPSNYTCTATSNTGAAVNGYIVSSYCENGYGSGETSCFAQTCSQVQSGNYQIITNGCAKYVCGPGYTGTATGPDNAGCTACTSKPSAATYTTNNSCNWECNAMYYKSNNTCVMCPPSSDGDIYMNQQLQGTRPGTTSGPGATSVSECYLPAGTYYDETGTFKIDTGTICAY